MRDAGYAEHSAAVYAALSACCHMGSAPMVAVRLHEVSKNGLAVWQRLQRTYRPHLSGNAEVDKELFRIEKEVPESQIVARLAA